MILRKGRTVCLLCILPLLLGFVVRVCSRKPTLQFCVPVDNLGLDSTTQVSSKNLFLNWIWGSGDKQLIFQSKHYLGYNYKVGFRSCESLGAEINKNMYIHGKVSLGGILSLGPWQMTISVQGRVLSVASEIDLPQLNNLCYNGDKSRLLSIFPFSEVVDRLIHKDSKTVSRIFSIPQPQSVDNPFTMYNTEKQTKHFLHLFASSEKYYVPLLAPIIFSKYFPSFISTTAQFSFGLNHYSISIKPTGTLGNGRYEEIFRSSKSGIVSKIDYGTSITVYSNITFLVTPDRSGAYGRDFQKVKRHLVHAIIELLLKSKAQLYRPTSHALETCPLVCENFSRCNSSTSYSPTDVKHCWKNQYVINFPQNRTYYIDDGPLLNYRSKFKNVSVQSVVWKLDHTTGSTHIWSRRNCAPLCAAIKNYGGKNTENQKMSLEELYNFLSLWQRFANFPQEFVSGKVSESPVAKAYGAAVEHAYPISFEVMTQKRSMRNMKGNKLNHTEAKYVYNSTLKMEKNSRENTSN